AAGRPAGADPRAAPRGRDESARQPRRRGRSRRLAGVVVAAYAQLTAAGYLETRPGGATRIAAGATVAPAPTDEPGEWIPRFNFGPYVPDLSAFPREEWLRSLREALASAPDAALGYRGPRGSPS